MTIIKNLTMLLIVIIINNTIFHKFNLAQISMDVSFDL